MKTPPFAQDIRKTSGNGEDGRNDEVTISNDGDGADVHDHFFVIVGK